MFVCTFPFSCKVFFCWLSDTFLCQREISANASAILAKHNITLNLPTKLEPSKEALDERKTDEPLDRQDTPESENGENGACQDSCTSLKSDYVNDNNNSNDTNNNILNDVNQDVLFKLTDDDKSSDDLIRRNAEAAVSEVLVIIS